MRSVVIRRFGGPDVLEILELPDPVPGVGQVRIAVAAAAVRAVVPGGVDAAIDAANLGAPALDAVRGGGSFVALLGGGPAPLRGIRVSQVWIRADGPRLASLAALSLPLRIADVLGLDDVAEAHRRLEEGRLRGRLVLVP